MNIPSFSHPALRNDRAARPAPMPMPEMRTAERSTRTSRPGAATPALVTPSACTAPDNNVIGQCFDQGGAVIGRYNCAGCCALRGAVGWYNPNTGVVVNC